MSYPFNPDWTLAPAALLRTWLDEHGAAPETLPRNEQEGSLILDVLDRRELTPAHAELLERCTRIPARHWMAWETQYRDDLAAGRKDTTPE